MERLGVWGDSDRMRRTRETGDWGRGTKFKLTPTTLTNTSMKTDRQSNSHAEKDQKTKGPRGQRNRRTGSIRVGKPRSDSTLDALTKARKEQLAVWLLDENRSYAEVHQLVAREWGVRTSCSALGRFYTHWLVPRQLDDAAEAAGAICPPSLKLRRGDDPFGEAARRRASQLGFMALMARVPDGKAARVFLGIVDAIERRQLARDRIALNERLVHLRELNETPPPKPPPLTDADRMAKYRGIFGLAPDYTPPAWREREEKTAAATEGRKVPEAAPNGPAAGAGEAAGFGDPALHQNGLDRADAKAEAAGGKMASAAGQSAGCRSAVQQNALPHNEAEQTGARGEGESPGDSGSRRVASAKTDFFSRAMAWGARGTLAVRVRRGWSGVRSG